MPQHTECPNCWCLIHMSGLGSNLRHTSAKRQTLRWEPPAASQPLSQSALAATWSAHGLPVQLLAALDHAACRGSWQLFASFSVVSRWSPACNSCHDKQQR